MLNGYFYAFILYVYLVNKIVIYYFLPAQVMFMTINFKTQHNLYLKFLTCLLFFPAALVFPSYLQEN